MVNANVIYTQLLRLISLYNRKLPQDEIQIHLEEWKKHFGGWAEEDFLEVIEEVKKSCSYFPRIADLHKAYTAISRRVEADRTPVYKTEAKQSHAQLWNKLGSLKRLEKYAEALEVVGKMEDSGIPRKWTDELRIEITAKLYGDERGALGAMHNVSMLVGAPLGQYVIKFQEQAVEAAEAGEKPAGYQSSDANDYYSGRNDDKSYVF